MFVEVLKTIVYGIVEGITEWLPISSTGHLILLEEILPLNVSKEFFEFFMVVIQLGAILAVVTSFFGKLNPIGVRSKKKRKVILQTWVKILIACVPAGVLGILFDDWFDAHFYNPTVVAIALIAYGVFRGFFEVNTHATLFDVMPPQYRSTSVGIFTVFAFLFGGLSGIVMGALSQRYGVHGFELGFGLMGGAYLLGATLMAVAFFFTFRRDRIVETPDGVQA